jgi:Leucine-rich repeat (LRR) protein
VTPVHILRALIASWSQCSKIGKVPTLVPLLRCLMGILFCWLFLSFFFHGAIASVSHVDIDTLWKLFNSTNGYSWKWRSPRYGNKWDFSTDNINPCRDKWQGVQCSSLSSVNCSESFSLCNISSLSLWTMNLTGTLPLEFGNFTDLQSCSITFNSLTGALPSTLSRLSSLISLDLSYNQLTEQLPSELGEMTNLNSLGLTSNFIQGTIPSGLFSLPSLEYLDLNNNCLTGSLPSQTITTSLIYLYLESNNLNGTIPSSLGYAINLIFLFLNSNSLSGTIPMTFGSLQNLISLGLSNNHLVGSFPSSFSLLVDLEYINLSMNSFYGSLPSATLCSMTRLISLALDQNIFTNSLPSCLSHLNHLNRLILSTNALTGTIPDIFQNFSRMFEIDLSQNSFHGTIPSSFFNITSLSSLVLNNNQLTGQLSEQLSQLSLLILIALNHNQFTGSLPYKFGHILNDLQLFYIHHNLFSNTLPSSYASLQSLRFLSIYENQLSQTIPTNLGSYPGLVFFDINTNHFTGTIPNFFSTLTELEYFHLFNNNLSGTIPSSLQRLTLLKYILIQSNQFTGHVHLDTFLPLTRLEVLQLQRNHFDGKFFQLINKSLTTSSSSGGGCCSTSISWDKEGLNGLNELRMLDVSLNLFTGSFPSIIFQISSLESLVMTSNCLHGSLEFEDTACQHHKLQVLILDGLASCPKHTVTIWNPLDSNQASASTPHSAMSGSIPSCLFDIPQLNVLHLGGNHLTGSLPDISSSSGIQNLSLTHNMLSGTIPSSILLHTFVELDLSSNKLTGTLDDMKTSPKASFNAKNNRLSGRIPEVFLSSTFHSVAAPSLTSSSNSSISVVILEGNSFTCKGANGQPDSDPGQGKYSCGSQNLDDALLIWLLVAIMTFIFIVISSFQGILHPLYQYLKMSLMFVTEINDLYHTQMNEDTIATYLNTKRLDSNFHLPSSSVLDRLRMTQIVHLTSMHHLQSLSFRISLFYLLVVLPILCILKTLRDSENNYLFSTYSIQQTWYPTGIYLSGTIPAITLLLGWVVVILYSLWNIMKYHRIFCMILYPLRYSHFGASVPFSSHEQTLSLNRPTIWTISSGGGEGDLEEPDVLDSEDDVEEVEQEEEEMLENGAELARPDEVGPLSTQLLPDNSFASNMHLHSRFFLSLLLALIIVTDIILVFIINFSYLLLQESHTSARNKLMGQIVLALFKTLFSSAIIPSITGTMFGLLKYDQSVHLFIRTASLLLNNLIIPAIVIALTSSSCFLHLFYSEDSINESYQLNNSTVLCHFQLAETGECSFFPIFDPFDCSVALRVGRMQRTRHGLFRIRFICSPVCIQLRVRQLLRYYILSSLHLHLRYAFLPRSSLYEFSSHPFHFSTNSREVSCLPLLSSPSSP